jgi:signal transduction histidine kinase/CheY-like chemotaxis protein
VSIPTHVSLAEDDLRLETASAAGEPDWAPALLEALPDLVIVIDATGRIVQRNRVAADLLGHRCPIGSDASLLAATSVDSERISPDIRAALAQNQTYRGSTTIADLHGRSAPYTLIVRRETTGATVIIARDTIAARERELLERERDATADFVRRLGHELRTPLNAVLGFAQLLELEALSPEQRADVQRILTGGRHMQALLDEVLDLSRVRSGHVDLDVASVPVLEVARSVIDLTTGLADARSMRIVLDSPDDFVARADRRRLTQVLLNLVDNAVKYGREGGTIRVALSRGTTSSGPAEGFVRIEVADEGPGVAPDALEKLFRPFERLGAEASGVAGTGLGLVLSRALVMAMGGTLYATSRVGAGMVLTVDLPTAAPRTAGQHTRRVVHVTADPSAATLVAQALRVRLGAQVEHVSDPELVPARVREVQPAVVLIDDTAPGMLSSDLVRRLGADPLTALVPTVVLCPETDPRVRLRLRAAGATSVLDVPLDVRALLNSVARHLPGSPIAS